MKRKLSQIARRITARLSEPAPPAPRIRWYWAPLAGRPPGPGRLESPARGPGCHSPAAPPRQPGTHTRIRQAIAVLLALAAALAGGWAQSSW